MTFEQAMEKSRLLYFATIEAFLFGSPDTQRRLSEYVAFNPYLYAFKSKSPPPGNTEMNPAEGNSR